MGEVFRRSLTGIVYVVLLLSTIFLSSDAFDFLFMAFGLACLFEFKKLIQLKGYYVFAAYLALWWLFIHLLHDMENYAFMANVLLIVTLITNITLLFYLFPKKEMQFSTLKKFIIGVFYIGGGCIFLTMIPYKNGSFAPFLIMGFFLLIWVNDSFAYLVGKTIGKNKLFPRVSPKKTWEGTLGGLIFALLAAYFIAKFESSLSLMQWFILALVIVLSGSIGDLLESKFKRDAGVKDSGAILPGHGGMLDRLDSLVFAAPFAYLTLNIFNYVS